MFIQLKSHKLRKHKKIERLVRRTIRLRKKFVRRVKIMIFYARIYSKTTTTILQNKDHHCPQPSANDLQAFGFGRSTTPSALNRKILDMLLQFHGMTQIGDLS